MNWWQWTLTSAGAYLGCGVVTSLCASYYQGRVGDGWSDEDYAITILLWPIYVVLVSLSAPYRFGRWLHQRGGTYKQRKQDRTERKETRRQIAELKEELGIK